MNNIDVFEENGFRVKICTDNEVTQRVRITALPYSKNIQFNEDGMRWGWGLGMELMNGDGDGDGDGIVHQMRWIRLVVMEMEMAFCITCHRVHRFGDGDGDGDCIVRCDGADISH